MSSAGERLIEPPHASVPPTFSATVLSLWASIFTSAKTSMISAVPAAELIALDDVLGMMSPAAATMGTTIRVILLPGHPPTE